VLPLHGIVQVQVEAVSLYRARNVFCVVLRSHQPPRRQPRQKLRYFHRILSISPKKCYLRNLIVVILLSELLYTAFWSPTSIYLLDGLRCCIRMDSVAGPHSLRRKESCALSIGLAPFLLLLVERSQQEALEW
jgi:hypothetical protein